MARWQDQPLLLQVIGGAALLGAVIGGLLGVWELLTAIGSPSGPIAGNLAADATLLGAGLLVAYPVLKERGWGRPLLVAFPLLVVLTGSLVAAFQLKVSLFELGVGLAVLALVGVVPAAPLAWYLYKKPNVVAYYQQLAEE